MSTVNEKLNRGLKTASVTNDGHLFLSNKILGFFENFYIFYFDRGKDSSIIGLYQKLVFRRNRHVR